MMTWLAALSVAVALGPGDVPTGQIVDDVQCQAAPGQTYTLYLPSGYTADRAWPVIYLFDAGGRGRNAVERYRDAAEQYGYILAGSNNSRNGRPNADAIASMPVDVAARFHVDPKRTYTGGMSGGARVALGTALDGHMAGVFASSAGFPDAEPRKTLSFAVYATTGTEDFNQLELRKLDRALTTPHRLTEFDGGHAYPPATVILDAIEWMELQAMKSRLKPRDEGEVERIFSKRLAAVGIERDGRATDGAGSLYEQYLALQNLASDFGGLRDVSPLVKRAAALAREMSVRDAIKRQHDGEDRESRLVADIQALEQQLVSSRTRTNAMVQLSEKWQAMSAAANGSVDSSERRMARREMAWLAINTMTEDEEYRDMVRTIRAGRGR